MKRSLCLLLILLFMLPLCASAAAEEAEQPLLRIFQLPLGCADGYLIVYGDTTILMDCGLDTDGGKPVSPDTILDAFDLHDLTLHIVSHYHFDHAGGISVISEKYYSDDTVLMGPGTLPEKYPMARGTFRTMTEGDVLEFGAMRMECLYPGELQKNGDDNVDSLNIVLYFGDFKMYFCGDFVHGLIRENHPEASRNVTVLKFPHHGLQPYAVPEKMLRWLNPQIVLVPGAKIPGVRSYLWNVDNPGAAVYGVDKGVLMVETDGSSTRVEQEVDLSLYRLEK